MNQQSIDPDNRSNISGYASLEELALDIRWSWSHSADKMWHQLDPELWELTHNPWVVLQTVSKEKLIETLADPDFRQVVEELIQSKQKKESSQSWFQKNYGTTPLCRIAYFSMEYMLSEALPIYSGGLGNVAGDQLKAASILGVPITAIGLLYQQGYFRQLIDKNGVQQALYPYNDPGQLPITPLRKSNGEWLRLNIALPGWSIWLRTWQVQVGGNRLLLLDSNDAANFPPYRAITSELYGGGAELRLQQELLLGIGGWRLLEELGIKPDVCHLNEGHAAFATLERARYFMKEKGVSFQAALAVTRGGNVFTTHTAVPAGFDRFSSALMEKYLGRYAQELGLAFDDFMALGRENPEDRQEPFNMAYLAIRGSGAINGVSALHGKISRQIFEPLFPHWPIQEIPVGYVTNGVHMPSWDSISADDLWTKMCGKERWNGVIKSEEIHLNSVSDVEIWKMRGDSRKSLIHYARKRLARQLAARGFTFEEVEQANHLFDENTLTLGFARRFATYKRPNMLLHDPERLLRILTNPQYPVQLVLAGKAHPADKPGQALIQDWIHFIQSRPEARAHIIFLIDYDMMLTEKMVQGVDVWINTPRRPWEACGTSGMKVLPNGGLNLSELDGWWVEAYTPEVGWAIGDGKEHGEEASWDTQEADQLYTLLEQEIIPAFYRRDREGIPFDWIAKMRASMTLLTPRFSANRAVRDYTEQYYVPAAKRFEQRASEKGGAGSNIVNWKESVSQKWPKIRFNEVKMTLKEVVYDIEAQVYLDGLDPDFVRIEIFANPIDQEKPFIQKMNLIRQFSGEPNFYIYYAQVPFNRPESDYTVRIVPFFPSVDVPLEEHHILWHK
ncbi:MAG: alpha-glucan family phosphorylase [Parachlamydiaceae bacterium]